MAQKEARQVGKPINRHSQPTSVVSVVSNTAASSGNRGAQNSTSSKVKTLAAAPWSQPSSSPFLAASVSIRGIQSLRSSL